MKYVAALSSMCVFLFNQSDGARADYNWKSVSDLCQAASNSLPSAVGTQIAQKAIDEYYRFGGHEVDSEGKLVTFGLVEVEQEEGENHGEQARLGDLGWWHVLKYWRYLSGHPDANVNREHEDNLYNLFRIWAFKDASSINAEDTTVKVIRSPGPLAQITFDRVRKVQELAANDSLATGFMKLFSENREDFQRGFEALREMSFRSAISDTAWSAAFVSYVVRMGVGNAPRKFPYDASHATYIYRAFQTSRDDAVNQNASKNQLYRACPPESTKPRVGDLVCYHRQKAIGTQAKPTAQQVRDALMDDIATGGERRLSTSHCDVVASMGQNNASIFVIGGNVLQSVTVKHLILNNQTGGLLEKQPCATPPGDERFSAPPSAGVHVSPVFNSKKCSLNASPWFVLLQQQ